MLDFQRLIAEINLDAIGNNVKEIKTKLKPETKLMAIVKADAYGHGALEISKVCLYNGADWLGIATCDEGISLRENNIFVPILILGYTVENQLESVVKYDLTQAVYSLEIAELLSKKAVRLGKTAKVHIKIDTGMGRIGFKPTAEALEDIEKIFHLPNIEVTGIFTHFATADEKDKSFTMEQYKKFRFVTDALNAKGHTDIIRHCGNSGAILDMPQLQLDMVRAGIILYGMWPSNQVNRDIKLIPAMSLKTHISFVKNVDENTSIGYGRKYYTSAPSKIATIPIGYADGYLRAFSNKAKVIVNNQYANVVGNVCMDQTMIDVSHIPNVKIGDTVVVMGQENNLQITADSLADIGNTINYEIVCSVGKRVPRVYTKNGQPFKITTAV